MTMTVLKRSEDSNAAVTFFCMPLPNEIIETSAPMPIITPDAVRNVRNRRFRRLVKANSTASANLMPPPPPRRSGRP